MFKDFIGNFEMKKILYPICAILFALSLGGCAASSTSPKGVNCNFSQERPLGDMPLDCQGGR